MNVYLAQSLITSHFLTKLRLSEINYYLTTILLSYNTSPWEGSAIIALRLFSWIHSFQSFDWFLEWFWLELILAFDLLLCRVTWLFQTKLQTSQLLKNKLIFTWKDWKVGILRRRKIEKSGLQLRPNYSCHPSWECDQIIKKTGLYVILCSKILQHTKEHKFAKKMNEWIECLCKSKQ